MASMRAFGCRAASADTQAMLMLPSSSMSICVPVSRVSAWMTLPPLPITSRILSGLIFHLMILRGVLREFATRRRDRLFHEAEDVHAAVFAPWRSATSMISLVMPVILMSICNAVTPFSVPATLKSMSPR